jgi:hypothetical protein
MIANLLQKVLVSTTVGTVIGFSSIFGAMSSAFALTIDSPEPDKGPTKDISNIVLYLKDTSGTISKVKIDSVSGTKSYNVTNFLKDNNYSIDQVVAYTVKAGSHKSGMGDGEGELFNSEGKPLDVKSNKDNLNKDGEKADTTFNYNNGKPVYIEGDKPPKAGDNDTLEGEETISETKPEEQPAPNEEATSPSPESQFVVAAPSQTNSSSQPVKVPEPGSIAAIAIFGLGGLLRKKKASS